MKNITTKIILASLVTVSSAFAAQTIKRQLAQNGVWSAAEIAAHDLWEKDACIATTTASKSLSTLELYAEKSAMKDGYVEPSILVVLKNEPQTVRGILTTDLSDEQIHLTLATTEGETPRFGLLARMHQRAQLVEALKKANTASVKLIDAKHKAVKTLVFSLKGSQKTVLTALKECALSLDFK
jgi:accessory colonization factor AcfC